MYSSLSRWHLTFHTDGPDTHQALINHCPTRTVTKQLLSTAAEVSACTVHVCGGDGVCVCAGGGWYCVCAGRKAAVRTQNRCSLLRTNVLQTQDPRCTATYFTLINPKLATVTCKKKVLLLALLLQLEENCWQNTAAGSLECLCDVWEAEVWVYNVPFTVRQHRGVIHLFLIVHTVFVIKMFFMCCHLYLMASLNSNMLQSITAGISLASGRSDFKNEEKKKKSFYLFIFFT